MTLKIIFHISDLHIRNGDKLYCRYDEYKLVFDNTIISIKERTKSMLLQQSEYIIIITGDIFHNKNNIGNYGLLLYKNFIQELTKICKVIVIPGNHDFNQSEINQPSLVYSSSFDIDNLIILNDSTSFIIDNIGFSYVAIDKTLDPYKNSGRIQDLPLFPEINEDVKYKIALFHGSFASTKLYNGEIMKEEYNPYPLEWIKDYNYVLLGDIHKRQVFNYKNKTICGYSGSLIQQNFGENILDHGYLIWDLENKKTIEVNVYNENGYINIKENEYGEILIRKNGKYEEKIEDVIKNNLEDFPKNIEIKIFTKINFQKLNNLLKKYKIIFTIISRVDERNLLNKTNIDEEIYNKEEINNLTDNNYILCYFKKILDEDKYNKLQEIIKNKEKLLFDVSKYPDDLRNECIRRNKELNIIINDCIKNDDIKEIKTPFLIKYLEWEGLLCYENKNWINMHELDFKSFMIKGKNGTGKSAIYDILLYSIWGSRNKDNLSGGFINHNKKRGYTIIDIELDGILYRIERYIELISPDYKKLNPKHVTLYKFINDKDLEILKKDKSCNDEVKKLFGSIDNFLSSSMITQEVDNDILKLDAKQTLEIIDKSNNIEYIYHLYNLFKTSINKYKDFKRIVESKKEVYEKLVSKNKNDEIDEEELKKINDELLLKIKEKEEIENEFNSIDIDIKNSTNLIILEIDYNKFINEIDVKKIITDEEYKEYKERYNELKFILKDVKDLKSYNNKYIDELKKDVYKITIKNKPCELIVLEQEEKQLKEYFNKKIENVYDVKELEDSLTLLNINYNKYENDKKQLIINKPFKINELLITKEELLKSILFIYNKIEELDDFIVSILISSNKECNNSIITYEEYKKLLENKNKLEETYKNKKDKLIKLEKDFTKIFTIQQTNKILNKQLKPIEKKYKTSASIKKEIKLINMKPIINDIENDEAILLKYKEDIIKINEVENELETYKNELNVLTTNDEYKYNPCCEYCCKRSWVCRMREIEIVIKTLVCDINDKKNKIEDYEKINERNEKNKIKRDKYDLLNEWYEYYKSKEEYEKITKELNKIISEKKILNEDLEKINKEQNEINNKIEEFINYSYYLYNKKRNLENYEIYKIWEINYNEILIKTDELNNEINILKEKINYNNNIKPRIDKYYELKDKFIKWSDYDNKMKIINSNELYKIKELIELKDKYNEYKIKNNKKPLIRRKLYLNDKLKLIERDIKILNDKIIKNTTINGYNKENQDNYCRLFDIILELDTILNILETIIINFQAFRIELYNNYILNKLIERTNKIIKTLCHEETKPFKLDYIITVSKDIIHINWLINNENINQLDEKKQIISVGQASGFQHFVISLALRMSLFINKYDIQCNQLYIDEGFVNFDKYNLSKVPSFIKSLLSYFNSIIIVSHIDLIQDTVDEIVEINYNKSSSVSGMEYGKNKKTIVKRNRK